jgi:hypothetical protein
MAARKKSTRSNKSARGTRGSTRRGTKTAKMAGAPASGVGDNARGARAEREEAARFAHPIEKRTALALDKQRRHIVDGMAPHEIAAERRAEWAEHVDEYLDRKHRDQLGDWAQRMGEKYGHVAAVHTNAVPWTHAFMVMRYGEEVAHWPTTLSERDFARMQQAEGVNGQVPRLGTMRALGQTPRQPDNVTLFGLADAIEARDAAQGIHRSRE